MSDWFYKMDGDVIAHGTAHYSDHWKKADQDKYNAEYYRTHKYKWGVKDAEYNIDDKGNLLLTRDGKKTTIGNVSKLSPKEVNDIGFYITKRYADSEKYLSDRGLSKDGMASKVMAGEDDDDVAKEVQKRIAAKEPKLKETTTTKKKSSGTAETTTTKKKKGTSSKKKSGSGSSKKKSGSSSKKSGSSSSSKKSGSTGSSRSSSSKGSSSSSPYGSTFTKSLAGGKKGGSSGGSKSSSSKSSSSSSTDSTKKKTTSSSSKKSSTKATSAETQAQKEAAVEKQHDRDVTSFTDRLVRDGAVNLDDIDGSFSENQQGKVAAAVNKYGNKNIRASDLVDIYNRLYKRKAKR